MVLQQSLLPDSNQAREQNKSSIGFTSGFTPEISPLLQTLNNPYCATAAIYHHVRYMTASLNQQLIADIKFKLGGGEGREVVKRKMMLVTMPIHMNQKDQIAALFERAVLSTISLMV